MKANTKAQTILNKLAAGEDREAIARFYGNKTWKSVDIYMRRVGYRWDSQAQTYVLKQPTSSTAVQEALQLTTKAAQIIRMLDVKHPNPRQVAIKHGFETVDALGEYMASQGYYWCNESQNYQYEAQPSPSLSVPDTSPIMTPPPAPTPSLPTGELWDVLCTHQDFLIQWLTQATQGQVPHFKVRGNASPKTLTLASTMIALLNDFSTEYNLSQRMIVEGALIEYFQKYGYGERVQQAIH